MSGCDPPSRRPGDPPPRRTLPPWVVGGVTAHVTAILTGHDPTMGEAGTDLLLTEYSDGHRELATRAGKGESWVTWNPPIELHGDERMPEDHR